MSTRELITDWLDKHQTFNPQKVSAEDYNHFVNILVDVADYCIVKYRERLKEYMKTHSWYNKEWYNYYEEMNKELNDNPRVI